MAEYLFVYGTLQRGLKPEMNRIIEAGAEFCGDAYVNARLVMLSWYPGLILATEESQQVAGELYRLHSPSAELLYQLDRYEGCGESDPEPHEYKRCVMDVVIDDKVQPAWVYLYTHSSTGLPVLVSGRFRDWVEGKDDPSVTV